MTWVLIILIHHHSSVIKMENGNFCEIAKKQVEKIVGAHAICVEGAMP